MLYREKIQAALEARRIDFSTFASEQRAEFAAYREALGLAGRLSRAELVERLAEDGTPGALPTEEFDAAAAFLLPFDQQWRSHEESRAWAYDTLIGRTTFAADGSQILPTKDFSVPVAAVQVGWFINPHQPGVPYVKDAAFEILTPDEVMVRTGPTELAEQVVHGRRYAMECGAIRNFMNAAAERGFDPGRPPVVFFDSLLVISFAELLPEEQRQFYIGEITALLETSLKTGVPIVGYVDTSFARDLTKMLQTVFGLEDARKAHDAALLAAGMKWGDRTPFFLCARRGILDAYGEFRRGVGFVYLKTSGDAPPARLDLPAWVYERGLLDYVVDTVRGEVIVGGGYPYAIEAADQTAVIGVRDREMFYAIFQEFADREHLSLRIAHKAISKAHRR